MFLIIITNNYFKVYGPAEKCGLSKITIPQFSNSGSATGAVVMYSNND